LPHSLRFPCSFTVLLTGDAAIRKLNRDFRGVDKPTNVLAFPQFEPSQLPKKGKAKHTVYLGDIVLGYQYIVGETKKYNKVLINHISHLVIHGLLHLLGYDHTLEKDATRMERLEQKIMAALDLPDPYHAGQPMEPKKVRTAVKKRRPAGRPRR
jgi:probable rRNA maturation factor